MKLIELRSRGFRVRACSCFWGLGWGSAIEFSEACPRPPLAKRFRATAQDLVCSACVLGFEPTPMTSDTTKCTSNKLRRHQPQCHDAKVIRAVSILSLYLVNLVLQLTKHGNRSSIIIILMRGLLSIGTGTSVGCTRGQQLLANPRMHHQTATAFYVGRLLPIQTKGQLGQPASLRKSYVKETA